LYKKEDQASLPAERREAVEQTFYEDLDAAIGWYSQVTMLVRQGEYDHHFEPRHRAVVRKSEGQITVDFVDGYKGKE
jgi:hypothetical protein